MGGGSGKLDPLLEVVDKTEVPITQILVRVRARARGLGLARREGGRRMGG